MTSEAESRRAISEVARSLRESQAKLGNNISQEQAERRIRSAVRIGEYQDRERGK